MVRNIVVLGGNSHPQLMDVICNTLGILPCQRILSKFSVGESRLEIQDSVRGKDVYIIQSASGSEGSVNDHFMELCIMISACKTGSANKVTAVMPLFPYSRQPDIPYEKAGQPHYKQNYEKKNGNYSFESRPATPGPGLTQSISLSNGGLGMDSLQKKLGKASLEQNSKAAEASRPNHSRTISTVHDNKPLYTNHDDSNPSAFQQFTGDSKQFNQPGYKSWVAQAGKLVADLLVESGADHVITMDLHDPQYQGFFDIPVDNLYGKPLLKRYIQANIPDYQNAVIVSPDAGGAKRATAIADTLKMDFALIHKERRGTVYTTKTKATMMLVGNVENKVAILIDDLADTSNTITRAARLLKKEGATKVYALLTHGVLSGDAIDRINASDVDKIIVTNTIPQEEHQKLCPKLEVLEVGHVLAEAIRRVYHGESISVLFNYD